MLKLLPLKNFPIIQVNDNLPNIIVKSLQQQNFKLQENDIVIIAHSIVSRAENALIELDTVVPSKFALNYCKTNEKDPRKVEVVLRECKSIVRMNEHVIITENKLGFISANSGVDSSNAKPNCVLILPENPDKSAVNIRNVILEELGVKVGVIVTDTFGRPLRLGTTNIAIGIAGIKPLESFVDRKDLYGYVLKTTSVARVDEIATAAGILMGQADESIPVVIAKGLNSLDIFTDKPVSAKELIRPRENALFW